MMRGMGNMQGMMKQMQKMQKELEQTQAQLNVTEFVGAASNDLVKITMTGEKKVTDVVIAPEVVDPEDVEKFKIDHRPEFLGGVTVLHGKGKLIEEDGWDNQTLYRRHKNSGVGKVKITAIPYATWANREASEMRVWFRDT